MLLQFVVHAEDTTYCQLLTGQLKVLYPVRIGCQHENFKLLLFGIKTNWRFALRRELAGLCLGNYALPAAPGVHSGYSLGVGKKSVQDRQLLDVRANEFLIRVYAELVGGLLQQRRLLADPGSVSDCGCRRKVRGERQRQSKTLGNLFRKLFMRVLLPHVAPPALLVQTRFGLVFHLRSENSSIRINIQ